MKCPLRHVRLLDPRDAASASRAPIRDAVNIPWSELPERVHELPPRSHPLTVAAVGAPAKRAVRWLRDQERAAELSDEFEYAIERSDPAGCRLWEPSAFLAECARSLTPGRALELACGVGRDAVYLASLGWDVLAVDLLADALERAEALRKRYAPDAKLHLQIVDLEAESPDFASAWKERFDLISVARYLHRPLLARFPGWLRPGGSLIYETFTVEHRARHGRPARDAHVLQPGELAKCVPDLRVVHVSEAWREDGHTARLWAIKPVS